MTARNLFRVLVEYDGYGHDEELFAVARVTLGSERTFSCGSGCGFGRRDHEWRNLTKANAERLAEAFRVVKTAPNLTVEVELQED